MSLQQEFLDTIAKGSLTLSIDINKLEHLLEATGKKTEKLEADLNKVNLKADQIFATQQSQSFSQACPIYNNFIPTVGSMSLNKMLKRPGEIWVVVAFTSKSQREQTYAADAERIRDVMEGLGFRTFYGGPRYSLQGGSSSTSAGLSGELMRSSVVKYKSNIVQSAATKILAAFGWLGQHSPQRIEQMLTERLTRFEQQWLNESGVDLVVLFGKED